jgi:transposase-like protein
VDKNNWYACRKAIDRYSDRDKEIIIRVYALYDTIADNVYEVAKEYQIDQNLVWDLLKEIERGVARKRGLI